MVKTLLITLLILSSRASLAMLSHDVAFKMEFSKREIFAGEQVLCHFNVYTQNELIEVEVAKFPEFRGFWNENLLLRQGPISTLFGLNAIPHSATVGTYVLIPMIGQAKSTIEPMKIVLRTPMSRRIEGSTPPEFMLSQGNQLVIKPLPPLPASLPEKSFGGAVGRFIVPQPHMEIPFQLGEPTQLSITLSGQGNFQEINDLPLEFPSNMEIISKRSYLQGSAQSSAKTYEYSITVKEPKQIEIAAAPFVYFNPEVARYETLSLPSLTFKPSQLRLPEISKDLLESTSLIGLAETYNSHRPFSIGIWMAIIHTLFGALLTALFFNVLRAKEIKALPQTKPSFLLELFKRLEETSRSASEGDALSAAEAYVFAWIGERLGIRPSLVTRAKLLELAEGKLSKGQKETAQKLIEASGALYSRSSNEGTEFKSICSEIPARFPLAS